MNDKERRREIIDMEWLESTLRSYLGYCDLTITKFDIWGIPTDETPEHGVYVRVKLLGREIPTPAEYIELLKVAFGDDYYIFPEEVRELPERYKGAMYLGSVHNRFLTWDDAMNERYTDVHYFLFDDTILPFNDDWIMAEGPRSLLFSYDALMRMIEVVGKHDREEKEEREEDTQT